jgi:hypothetical protein
MSRQPTGAGSVYLHIGEPKTGTTYLQQILWANRGRLLEQGLLIPGKRPVTHWAAAQDLRQVEEQPNDPFGPLQGAWDRLAAEALRAPGAAVISHELLAAVDADQAARAVKSLHPARVHVVLTVRDIATLLPAEWQETIKHRSTRAWRDWLSAVIDDESVSPDRRHWFFWRVHDTLEILRVWSKLVPPDRVHVITVPSSRTDPDLLWQRFAQVIGLQPAPDATATMHRNPSLSLAETEFLRRLNAALPERLPDWFYMRSIKDGLAHEALAADSQPSTDRLYLPREREEWARKYADSLVADLRASAYHLVGDLDELLPQQLPEQRPDPSDVPADQILAAAVDAAVGLVYQAAAHQGIVLVPDEATATARTPGRVKRTLIELSRRSPALHALRRRYWNLANMARRIRGPRDRWRAVEDRDIS